MLVLINRGCDNGTVGGGVDPLRVLLNGFSPLMVMGVIKVWGRDEDRAAPTTPTGRCPVECISGGAVTTGLMGGGVATG